MGEQNRQGHTPAPEPASQRGVPLDPEIARKGEEIERRPYLQSSQEGGANLDPDLESALESQDSPSVGAAARGQPKTIQTGPPGKG